MKVPETRPEFERCSPPPHHFEQIYASKEDWTAGHTPENEFTSQYQHYQIVLLL